MGFGSVFADVLLQTCSVYRAMATFAGLCKGVLSLVLSLVLSGCQAATGPG